jgi:hypothetical protein
VCCFTLPLSPTKVKFYSEQETQRKASVGFPKEWSKKASCEARIGADACLAGWNLSNMSSGAGYATNAARALARRVTAKALPILQEEGIDLIDPGGEFLSLPYQVKVYQE